MPALKRGRPEMGFFEIRTWFLTIKKKKVNKLLIIEYLILKWQHKGPEGLF